MADKGEQWKPVVGYEGLYEVSNQGRVFSVLRRDSRGHKRGGHLLKPAAGSKGHLRIGACKNGKMKNLLVHRLVLEAFVGPSPEGTECCHNDGNPSNNHLSNLRWDSRRENQLDSVRHGTHWEANMTHCKRGHEFTEENTYVCSRGLRNCKECRRMRDRENWPKRAEARRQRRTKQHG